jgi:hypothetical protein
MESTVQSKRGFNPKLYMLIGDDQLVTLALKFVLESGKQGSGWLGHGVKMSRWLAC